MIGRRGFSILAALIAVLISNIGLGYHHQGQRVVLADQMTLLRDVQKTSPSIIGTVGVISSPAYGI